jgi:hypothetical protein
LHEEGRRRQRGRSVRCTSDESKRSQRKAERGDRIPHRLSRVAEVRRERRDGRTFTVYALTDSLRKPQGKPPRVGADWRHAA